MIIQLGLECYVGYVIKVSPSELKVGSSSKQDKEIRLNYDSCEVVIDPSNITISGARQEVFFERGFNSEGFAYFQLARNGKRFNWEDYKKHAGWIRTGRIVKKKSQE
ncbi:MAG: hypothetical protein NT076_04260 [Candidatus Pacearchaeota archaeon]|nr:hypothetical protein [Candidatus Pacearchaeota archaeon]